MNAHKFETLRASNGNLVAKNSNLLKCVERSLLNDVTQISHLSIKSLENEKTTMSL
jgi:hypothetical protein